jgi:hypothetical protein
MYFPEKSIFKFVVPTFNKKLLIQGYLKQAKISQVEKKNSTSQLLEVPFYY